MFNPRHAVPLAVVGLLLPVVTSALGLVASGGDIMQAGGPQGLGASIPLRPVTKTSGCHVRGPLPDRGCTPGTRYRLVTKNRVCAPGYSQRVRNVPDSRKNAVYSAYGIKRHFNGRNGEIDHLVSLELGGTNATANLFPEAASPRPGSHEKDRLENRLHDLVCSGQVTLRHAQKMIAKNWLTAYKVYVLPI